MLPKLKSHTRSLAACAWLCTLLCTAPALATTGPVIPTDGMVILTDTTFLPGTYALPTGISIGAANVTLDLNGAELVGAGGVTYGITSIGHDSVTIRNGTIRGYYYGIRIEQCSGVTVADNDLSHNYVDPASLGPGAPFLNINVGPALPDLTNLGGGLYLREVSDATISGNTLRHGENGMDLFFVSDSVIADNDASDNTGWGIHLHASTKNLISGNTCDDCTRPGLGDSAGMLLVNGSSGNTIVGNSFRGGGDGFFIGNEWGCPSNDNLVMENDGSNAGANAFEATFSSGNRFINNIANGSNYGFWLGYSHSGNVIEGNQIKGNNVNGIEIEHGQDNAIRNNVMVGNGGKGIVLRTDNAVHFPPEQFPCLALPNQAASSGYEITGNVIQQNFSLGMELINTTDSLIANNLFAANAGGTATSNGAGNVWSTPPTPGRNIVGGPTLGGNYWSNYAGVDLDADGLGDTMTPYTNGGAIVGGDPHPLIGDPPVDPFDNPMSLCNRLWVDLGPNTRSNGSTFQTSNGTHYATDGTDLYLLEGSNNTNFDRFDPTTNRYVPLAPIPEAVFDGGDLQFGQDVIFATVGLTLDPVSGAGKGPKLYAYSPAANSWTPRTSTTVQGALVSNEAIAFDPESGLLYATVVSLTNGAPTDARSRLAIYDPAADAWIGATSAGNFTANPGSEAEYLDGKIYVWRGGFAGGGVSGNDSYLDVYDIATDTWSTTPTLQSAGIVPGFRSGAFDVWGVAITSDPNRKQLFVLGGEANNQIYLFDVATQTWTLTPNAIYDGGWGDGLEYVPKTERLYQIDGRNVGGTVQGTAVLVRGTGDVDGSGHVDGADLGLLLGQWGECGDECCSADLDENGVVDGADLGVLLGAWHS